MRRALIVSTVGLLVVLLLVTPDLVAAKQGAPRFFSLTGEITALDGTIWVEVLDGNPLVQHYINGDDLQVQVTEDTEYWRCTGTGREDLEYGQLLTGWIVYIHGTFTNGEFTAERVVVDKPEK